MSIASALLIACNLLLAMCVYMLATTYRRSSAMRLVLVGSFLAIAAIDLSLQLRGNLDPGQVATMVLLDVVLVWLAVAYVRGDRPTEQS